MRYRNSGIISFDFDREIENTLRSVHRHLVRTDDMVRSVESNVQHLQLSVEYLSAELSKLKTDLRVMCISLRHPADEPSLASDCDRTCQE